MEKLFGLTLAISIWIGGFGGIVGNLALANDLVLGIELPSLSYRRPIHVSNILHMFSYHMDVLACSNGKYSSDRHFSWRFKLDRHNVRHVPFE